jgi:DNA-binding NtrC family response regulator
MLRLSILQQNQPFSHLNLLIMEPSRRVFVVDDRTLIAESLATILNEAGFRAMAFDDPTVALSAASIKCPDILISDVIMPRMTGIDLGIRIRNAHPECRVLLYSGQIHTADLLEKAKKQGHEFEILAKPVHPDELLEKLRESPLRS